MTILLETRNLSCERDERVLVDNLNLHVEPGFIYQIEGPNGSGKTSLLRVLCGLSTRFTGEIYWQGESIARQQSLFLSHLLYLGHHSGVKTVLTPRENLQWHSAIKGDASSDRIEHALKKVGLYGYEDVACYTLSAGQQRRVALARLFLADASLWVLDEPFTAIDKVGVSELEKWIQEYAAGGGAVILTTHHELSIIDNLHKISLGG